MYDFLMWCKYFFLIFLCHSMIPALIPLKNWVKLHYIYINTIHFNFCQYRTNLHWPSHIKFRISGPLKLTFSLYMPDYPILDKTNNSENSVCSVCWNYNTVFSGAAICAIFTPMPSGMQIVRRPSIKRSVLFIINRLSNGSGKQVHGSSLK